MEQQFIKHRDIILFGFQSWDTDIGSNFKDMALELSKYNRVLYVNRALDRSFLIKNKDLPEVIARKEAIKTGKGELSQVAPNLWVQHPRTILESINWIPVAFLHDWMNRINNKRLAKQIRKASRKLGFKNVILMNDNDFIRGRYLKQLLKCDDYIFYIRDFMLGVAFFQRHGHRLEAGTMKAADMVVANSTYLANYARKFNRNSFDIGQGCDLKNYTADNPKMPEDLEGIKRPMIGYVGFISAWRIDIEVIRHMAEQLPAYSIVLVGPDDLLPAEAERLKKLHNIHFLGRKPQETLSNYIHYFDVCINPQVLNTVTVGNYPRKVDEYLAMGKPVVATRTEAMKLFAPYTYLCENKEDYVKQVRKILLRPDESMSEEEVSRRKAFAFSHTWEDSIGRLGDAYYKAKYTIH
jgi:teichuronic acid biosynthesis glycosyltransferase TuaH